MIALADCAVVVTDVQKAADWWKDKLGFVVHTVGAGDHSVMVAPPGDRFVLHLCEGFEEVQSGNSGIAFVTDELEQMVRRMEGAGVEFPEPLVKSEWGGMAKFADPDGNVFWLLGAPTSFIKNETGRIASRSAPSRPRPARRKVSKRSSARR